MRVALVSPYSHTYLGGVGQHVEALAEQFIGEGHDVRVLSPYDPDDRRARVAHRGARPTPRPLPDYVIPLGRSVGLPANGSVANLAVGPRGVATLGRELRFGGYDVVHVHEPNAPVMSWFAMEHARSALVATFHTYDPRPLVGRVVSNVLGARRLYNKAHVRIAVSEAARWTAERFYGGRYRIVPNGVDLSRALTGPRRPSADLRLLYVGRADERKGLPVLLRAFEALRGAGVEARLTIVGATPEEVEPYLLDGEGIEVAGRVSEEEKWRCLHDSDVLCAPSLRGESFGMVLTEAFAAGTPVVCSDIAGYRDVVSGDGEGVLVPPADAAALGDALYELARDPERRARMGEVARRAAERFAWPNVAAEVMGAYEDAITLKETAPSLAVRTGMRPADRLPAKRPHRLPSLDPPIPGARRRRAVRVIRRGAAVGGALVAAGLAALALQRIGIQSVGHALLAATPTWVLLACALMCLAMFSRAESWHSILGSALPGARVRRIDATRGIMIGVLMSATLPARLGEFSRALVVANRLGRVRQRLPLVLGTIVSQTLLNLIALAVLGGVMFATVGLFKGHEAALVLATAVPVLLVAFVIASPTLLRRGGARFAKVEQISHRLRGALEQVRGGLVVFRNPRRGAWAAAAQLLAWALQWLACYTLLVALGLDHRAGLGAAAAVLFAVNVTAALPATPSNIGVFQAACVAVLSAYGVGHTAALAYGIILQAVEIATAFALGMPALVGEGMSWRDLRLRALHSAPVKLSVSRKRERTPESAGA